MTAAGRRLKLGLAAIFVLALAACTTIYRNHGYAPSDADLALITVGTDTRDSVAAAVGAPGTSGLLAGGDWYYVQSRYENFAYRAPKEVDRQVVAIRFDDAGTVTNIERYGLADGRVIGLSRRVTEANVRGISFLKQLFGNIGRIDPATVFRDSP